MMIMYIGTLHLLRLKLLRLLIRLLAVSPAILVTFLNSSSGRFYMHHAVYYFGENSSIYCCDDIHWRGLANLKPGLT
jgi:hypothetical protein